MKQSALLALIGVAIIVVISLVTLLLNITENFPGMSYYVISSICSIAGWVLIGQFFFALYKKSK